MLSKTWGSGHLKVLTIGDTWAIRENSFDSNLSVLIHKCGHETIGFVHNLYRQDRCDCCQIEIPDYVQAVWYLSNWDKREMT